MSMYQCKTCHNHWNYPVKKCIFCNGEVEELKETNYKVIGFTQVNIPSTGNEKVPYNLYLLEDKNGNKIIKKMYNNYSLGDYIDFAKTKIDTIHVGIIGTGQLGSGIAEYFLRFKYPIKIKSRSTDSSDKVLSRITKKLLKDNTKEQVDSYIKNLTITTNYSDLKDCDLIIEAVSEDIDIKKEVFKTISNICDNKTIFATNTSSLSIDDIAIVTDRPEKCIGMHFFNPVSKMDLIEIIIGKKTSNDTKGFIVKLSKEINKKPILVNNSPGFIVNRLLLPQINEATRLFENGIATKEDIDSAMKLGLNHPMGPFALADLIGIDICVLILNTLYESTKDERFKPAQTLIDLIQSGKLGYKTGEGFYKY